MSLSHLYEARRAMGSTTETMTGPARVVAICNQKGGCGKTTTAINLAAGLSLRGDPTLLIDLDPQGHATLGLGVDGERLTHTIYDLFHDSQSRLEDLAITTRVPLLSLVPANALLAGAQLELGTGLGREQVLQQAIVRLAPRFRHILVDCSPSLNLLTINALTAADFCLVPLQPHYYALEGMKELFTTIELMKERFNPKLRLLGIVTVLVDGRMRITRELLAQIQGYFQGQLMQSSIRLSPKLVEASIAGQPAVLYAPASSGAQDYSKLTEEVLARMEQGNGTADRPAG